MARLSGVLRTSGWADGISLAGNGDNSTHVGTQSAGGCFGSPAASQPAGFQVQVQSGSTLQSQYVNAELTTHYVVLKSIFHSVASKLHAVSPRAKGCVAANRTMDAVEPSYQARTRLVFQRNIWHIET